MIQQDAIFMQKFVEYRQFATVAEMDEHIQKVLAHYEEDLNKTDAAVLDYLKQRATKIVGVAWVKVDTVAAGIGKSYRTVSTSTKKLSELGIISKFEVMRSKSGGNGASAYILKADCLPTCLPSCLPQTADRDESETPTESKDEQAKTKGISLNSFISLESSLEKDLKKSEKAAPAIAFTVELFPNIPEVIKHSLRLLGDNKLANEIWKKVVQAYVQSDLYNELGRPHIQTVCEDDKLFEANLKAKIHNVVYAEGHKTVRTDVLGYMYATCKGYFNDEAVKLIEESAESFDMDTYYNDLATKLWNERPLVQPQQHAYIPAFDNATKDELDELGVF